MSIKFTPRPDGFNDYFWDKPDEAILRRLWPWLPTDEIAKIIPRSSQSILLKAGKLGLKKDREAGWRDNWMFINHNPYERLSETERAYLAGIFDGEGTIGRHSQEKKKEWRISIGNTSKELIGWLHKKVPYSLVHKVKLQKHWKQMWTWLLCSSVKVFRILELIGPHLIVKKSKVDAAMEELYPRWKRLYELRRESAGGYEFIGDPAKLPLHWSERTLSWKCHVRHAQSYPG